MAVVVVVVAKLMKASGHPRTDRFGVGLYSARYIVMVEVAVVVDVDLAS